MGAGVWPCMASRGLLRSWGVEGNRRRRAQPPGTRLRLHVPPVRWSAHLSSPSDVQRINLAPVLMTSPSIVFEPLFPDVSPPVRATQGSAGYDVAAYVRGRTVRVWKEAVIEERVVESDELLIRPGEVALVPSGFRARLPDGYEAQMRVRSSIAFRRGLIVPNAPGTIDADYPDEWLVMMKNISHADVHVAHGERIAQVVLARYEVLGWERGEVRVTTRAGGVGSTGA